MGRLRFGRRKLDSAREGAYFQPMSDVVAPIITTFRSLPATEKIRLVQQFWDEIADEVALTPVSAAQQRLLDERIDDHEANPDAVESWETVRDDILRTL